MKTAYTLLKDYIPLRSAVKSRADGDFLVVSNRSNEIYYLNGTAREMWDVIDGRISIDDICGRFMHEYEVDRERLEGDIVNFIRDMQWKKLIRLKTGGVIS